MKKFFSIFAVLSFLGFALIAEQTYTVKAVSGKVAYRSADGSWVPVRVGMDLSDSVKVATGLNSTMVVDSGAENTVVILPLNTGNVGDVVVKCMENAFIKDDIRKTR